MEARTDKRVAVFFANGMEEIEGLTVVDILYRAGIPCDMVSITSQLSVISSHNVALRCQCSVPDADFNFNSYDMLVLPGGLWLLVSLCVMHSKNLSLPKSILLLFVPHPLFLLN